MCRVKLSITINDHNSCMAHQWLLFSNQTVSVETQRVLMMRAVTSQRCFSQHKSSVIVLVKTNDGHDEAKPLQSIVSVGFFVIMFARLREQQRAR